MPDDQADKAAKDAADKAAKDAADKAAKAIRVSRADLDRLGACIQGHATFAERFKGIDGAAFDAGTETWTLARGWTRDVTRQLAVEAPVSLRWYVRHGIAPADCGWREAIQRAQFAPGGAVRPALFGRAA